MFAKEYAGVILMFRHRLTLSITYAIPGKKGFGQVLEGWEINSIATMRPTILGTD